MISESTLWLQPRPPFRLDLTAWAIRRRPENKIDRWDGSTYSRVLAIGNRGINVSVTQKQSSRLRLKVASAKGKLQPAAKAEILRSIEGLLGIRIDLAPFYAFSSVDARLALLARRFQGLKPPRFPSVFEALVNGIACQQLSLAVGIILLGRLSEAYGLPFEASETQYSFPVPSRLAAANASDLRQMGFSSNKCRALIELASAVAAGQLDVEGLAAVEDVEAISYLLKIRGIGRWTAEYVLLRGLGRTNIFPGDDVGARNNFARWRKLRSELDYEGVARRLSKWKPYAGLIYFHLLMDSLERAGFVQSGHDRD